MSKLVMNIKNESNLNNLIAWCKQYHIEYSVIEDNSMPVLVDESKSTKSAPQTSKKSDDKFPSLGKAEDVVGNVSRYGKFVRNWEYGIDGKPNGFVMDNVKYATKMAIKNAGATWNAEKGAYEFKTVKAAKEFIKAQVAYDKERRIKQAGKAIVR